MNCFFIASWVDILHCELDACTRRLNAPKQKRLRNTRRCGHRGAEKVEISAVNWIVLRPRLAALRQFRSQPPASRSDTYEEPASPSQKTAECRSRAWCTSATGITESSTDQSEFPEKDTAP